MESEKILLGNLERKAQEYANQIMASKEELKELDSVKEKIRSEHKALLEKVKKDIQIERDNFNRIVTSENKRLDDANLALTIKENRINELLSETIAKNQQAEAREAQSIEDLNKIKKELERAENHKKSYEELLTITQKKDNELTLKLKTIQPDLENIEKIKKENSDIEQNIIKSSQILAKKEMELSQKNTFLLKKEETIEKRDELSIKREKDLVIKEEALRKKDEENKIMRSDLEAGHRNLATLQKELEDLIKLKEFKK